MKNNLKNKPSSATKSKKDSTQKKDKLHTPSPPVGAYSVARALGPWLFISGQIPMDPQTGKMVSGDIGHKTKKVMQNIKVILDIYKLNFSNIIKTSVFLTKAQDFTLMNQVYQTYFKAPFPARSCVIVKALPKGADIEIEVIAHLPHSRGGKIESLC